MKIQDAKGKIKVGDWVRTNGDGKGTCKFFEGEIGEILEDRFFVFQDIKPGSRGSILPHMRGYKCSWSINFSSHGEIEIIKSNQTLMSKPLDVFRKLFLKEEDRLMTELGLENPAGTPTDDGIKILLEVLYAERRKDLIANAQEIKKAMEEEKK